ncbi:MAG: DUF1444 family protein [Niastella sp.]|nr:DUF1444 family protein [Niastella sp.]
MRPLLTLLPLLLILSCNSRPSVMPKEEFAKVYIDTLSKRYPTFKFELNSDLSITAMRDSIGFKHFIDNIYVTYEAEPDSIQSIFRRYLASTADLFKFENKGINTVDIIPVIKPGNYLEEVNAQTINAEKPAPLVSEKYNNELLITYVQDTENSMRYLTDEDLKKLNITKDSLKAIAIRNLDRVLPNAKIHGGDGVYMVTAGGNYEASLILPSVLWTKENFAVKGDFVMAVPSRDLLLITGSNDKAGIAKLKEFVAKSYKTGNYTISDHLFKWTGKKFERFD